MSVNNDEEWSLILTMMQIVINDWLKHRYLVNNENNQYSVELKKMMLGIIIKIDFLWDACYVWSIIVKFGCCQQFEVFDRAHFGWDMIWVNVNLGHGQENNLSRILGHIILALPAVLARFSLLHIDARIDYIEVLILAYIWAFEKH